jgi:carboxylesterase
MVKRLIEMAGKVAIKAKSILFADPGLLYKEERHLVNQPFLFEGTNGKGVLLVHGWTSTPYELRRLGKYLNEAGYTVMGIQLTGHGTVPKDLEGVKWQQWIEDVSIAYKKLQESCDKVYVAGTSIGANLAIILAEKEKGISALILMATPYKIRFEKVMGVFAKILLKLNVQYRKKFYPPTFGSKSTITRIISYQTYPVRSVLETLETIKESRLKIPSIQQPCLIMQSTSDHIVTGNSAEKIYNSVGSQIKKKIYIKKAYHTFISDIKNEHVFEDILNFLNEN